jgi:hypothetical protein
MPSPSRKCHNSAVLSTAATIEKPLFFGRLSVCSLTEKSGWGESSEEGEELGSNLLQVIERTRSGLDRHRLWQQYNGIWIFAMSGRAEMGVLLIRRIRAYVTGENISLYVLGWDLLDIVPVQRNRRFVAVELNPDAVAVAAATDDDAFPLGSARATRRTARAHSKSGSYGNGRRR